MSGTLYSVSAIAAFATFDFIHLDSWWKYPFACVTAVALSFAVNPRGVF